jgi:multidrug efflux system membrane fusion protein
LGWGALVGLILVVAVVGLGSYWEKHRRAAQTAGSGPPGQRGPGGGPVPVIGGMVSRKDVPIYLDGLGNVQAFNTVVVRARVDGQVEKIAFVEGQDVQAGELLAQIDAAPFQAQLDQSIAKKAQDEAQLEVARVTLQRDAKLLADKILSQQDYDTQKATVEQFAAAVKADQAAIESAKVQLAYTKIASPLEGRTGIRQVDQGNIIHANDSNGLVVITQLRPISVVFTLPEQDLGQIQEQLSGGRELQVLAVDRDDKTTLGTGKLAVIDNQIDTSTGTIRLKATFPNEQFRLWPGQFVNARLLVTVRKAGNVVPASVVQRGPDGSYAYVIKEDLSVETRPVHVAHIEQGEALIDSGLQPGEQVVVDGQYKLQPGAHVKLSATNAAPRTAQSQPTSASPGKPAPD